MHEPSRAREQDADHHRTARLFLRGTGILGVALGCSLSGCADRTHQIVVSVPEQRMVVLERGVPLAIYQVSTSKFGVGDAPGTCETPLGELEVAEKIGGGAPLGMKFKSRLPTGEIVPVDAPGRDPVVTRILWLRGREAGNASAYDRYIYIHGTPEERKIGQPASFGCVRMRSRDVVRLYDEVGSGAKVYIRAEPLARASAPYLAAGAFIPTSTSQEEMKRATAPAAAEAAVTSRSR